MWRELFKLPLTANIIDIGGGDSHFVDALLEKGYQNIWVLDISEIAIERAKRRLVIKDQSSLGRFRHYRICS
ncbi:MAG TPA: hypothetical protein VGW31_12160 [Hanamia sp.]|nr:hypothetical protein [Hanamia sp.]